MIRRRARDAYERNALQFGISLQSDIDCAIVKVKRKWRQFTCEMLMGWTFVSWVMWCSNMWCWRSDGQFRMQKHLAKVVVRVECDAVTHCLCKTLCFIMIAAALYDAKWRRKKSVTRSGLVESATSVDGQRIGSCYRSIFFHIFCGWNSSLEILIVDWIHESCSQIFFVCITSEPSRSSFLSRAWHNSDGRLRLITAISFLLLLHRRSIVPLGQVHQNDFLLSPLSSNFQHICEARSMIKYRYLNLFKASSRIAFV